MENNRAEMLADLLNETVVSTVTYLKESLKLRCKAIMFENMLYLDSIISNPSPSQRKIAVVLGIEFPILKPPQVVIQSLLDNSLGKINRFDVETFSKLASTTELAAFIKEIIYDRFRIMSAGEFRANFNENAGETIGKVREAINRLTDDELLILVGVANYVNDEQIKAELDITPADVINIRAKLQDIDVMLGG